MACGISREMSRPAAAGMTASRAACTTSVGAVTWAKVSLTSSPETARVKAAAALGLAESRWYRAQNASASASSTAADYDACVTVSSWRT